MKECFIGWGECNYFYFYVLYCLITHFLVHSLLSFDYLYKMFSENGKELGIPILKNHPFIESLYQYLGFIIIGSILYFIFVIKKSKSKINNENNNNNNIITSNKLIYNKKKMEIKNVNLVILLFVCFLLFFQLELYDILYSFNFYYFDFWIFNIIFTLLFMYKIFKIKPFLHHYLSIIFIIIIDIILILIATFIPDKETDENAYSNVEKILKYKSFAIFIIIFFIIISCSTAFARVEVKKIMEIKYISPLKLIILIGFIGVIFTLLSLAISNKFECNEDLKEYCKVNDQTKIYFDNFSIYKSNLNAQEPIKFWIEIFVFYPLIIIGRFIKFYFELLIIYYLNPVFVLICDEFYYAIKENIFLILKFEPKFFVKISANIIAIIGYFIYLEIIELRFCGLNKNLRKNINKRAKTDHFIEFRSYNGSNENDRESNNSCNSSNEFNIGLIDTDND